MKAIFLNEECDVSFDIYSHLGRPAIQLWRFDGNDYREPMATATINLPDEDALLDEVFIKDYSENSGMVDALVAAGIIHPPHRYVSSGWVAKVPVCRLTDEALREVENEKTNRGN